MKWRIRARSPVLVAGRTLSAGEMLDIEGETLPKDAEAFKNMGLVECFEMEEPKVEVTKPEVPKPKELVKTSPKEEKIADKVVFKELEKPKTVSAKDKTEEELEE